MGRLKGKLTITSGKSIENISLGQCTTFEKDTQLRLSSGMLPNLETTFRINFWAIINNYYKFQVLE